jgi:hemerythrin
MRVAPIKRSKELVALSKDHHEGLLIVWKIRQGLRYEVGSKRIAEFILYAFKKHLEPHFKDEEELLFTKVPGSDKLLVTAIEQQAFIRQQVELIKTAIEVTSDRLSIFANALKEHIRFEERVLFQHLERVLSALELEEIGEVLKLPYSELKPLYWHDEFWLNK